MIKEIKFLGFTRDNKCFSKTLFDEYSKERRIQSLINDEPIPSRSNRQLYYFISL